MSEKIGAEGTQLHAAFATLGVSAEQAETLSRGIAAFNLAPGSIIALLIKYGPVFLSILKILLPLFAGSASVGAMEQSIDANDPLTMAVYQDIKALTGN